LHATVLGFVPTQPAPHVASCKTGLVAGAMGSKDVMNGDVALIALEREALVLTSDPGDIARWGVPTERIGRC
jgi:hypothetical protein